MTSEYSGPVTTEIEVAGVNCPWCLNETLGVLRHQPGVVWVDASMSGQCLRSSTKASTSPRSSHWSASISHADGTASADT